MPNPWRASRANVNAMERVADELMRRGAVDAQHLPVLIELADGECSEEECRQFLTLTGLG